MEFKSNISKAFINTVTFLPHDVYNFEKVELLRVDLVTEKAALIVFQLKETTRSKWVPYSQIRKDSNNQIWLPAWLLKKIMSDPKDD